MKSETMRGVHSAHEPEPGAVNQGQSLVNSCGGSPDLELQVSEEPHNVVAEDDQGNLDKINAMISEGGPAR